MMDYRDFVLVARAVELNPANQPMRFRVQVFDSPVGQGEQEELVEVPQGLDKKIAWLKKRQLDETIDEQINLGEVLAGLLLPEYARKLFAESFKRLREGQGLRLRLRLDDALADIPWEYLYIQDARGERTTSGFLALDPRLSIVRQEAIAIPGDWFETPSKRRVLVLMASPQNENPLPHLPQEQQHLKAALTGVEGIEAVYYPNYSIAQKPSATLEDLALGLMQPTDVFHFAGHGVFERKMGAVGIEGAGSIVLADAANQAVYLPADRLAEMLRGRGVRLVVLGACETGERDGQNVWSSVVASLLKAGIPAVVSMQFSINDALGAAFSGAFYRGLVAGFAVDEAMALGRFAIRSKALELGNKDTRDWGVPVLYLRAQNGVVFNPVSSAVAVQQAEAQAQQLVEQNVREVGATGRVIGAVVQGVKNSRPIRVQQKVDQELRGLMVGGVLYGEQDGSMTIQQTADVVSGTLIGATIGVDPLGQLAGGLGVTQVKPATQAFCPKCGKPTQPEWKFCMNCGNPLGAG